MCCCEAIRQTEEKLSRRPASPRWAPPTMVFGWRKTLTTRIAAAGDRTGQWVAEGGPAWLDGQSVNGGLDTATGYRFLHLTVPDGIPVGTKATTTVVEQQRDASGNDLGRVDQV